MRRKLIIATALVLFILLASPYYLFLTRELKISPIKALIMPQNLKKVGDQTNILLLGIPGVHHEGPYLSDSILLINYDFKKNRIITIGIPRDLWSSTLKDKINAAYALGEAKRRGGGLALARAEVSSVVGFPVQYAAVIDFSGFKYLIDEVGGVDVEVARSFVDKKFPIAGRENADCHDNEGDTSCRYETVRFTKGSNHMNGETALKYVRSRNAIGAEGSDFARSRRQEQVIDSLKKKLTGELITLNPQKQRALYKVVDKTLKRTISNQEVAILSRHIFLRGGFYTKQFTLPPELFEVPPVYEYGRYVLIPLEKWSFIHTYVQCLLNKEDESSCRELKNE